MEKETYQNNLTKEGPLRWPEQLYDGRWLDPVSRQRRQVIAVQVQNASS